MPSEAPPEKQQERVAALTGKTVAGVELVAFHGANDNVTVTFTDGTVLQLSGHWMYDDAGLNIEIDGQAIEEGY